MNAAVKQIEDIELIRQNMGFESLNEALADIAKLRLQYPEATLKELGMMLGPRSESPVNHRLRKLSMLADTLRESKEELLRSESQSLLICPQGWRRGRSHSLCRLQASSTVRFM